MERRLPRYARYAALHCLQGGRGPACRLRRGVARRGAPRSANAPGGRQGGRAAWAAWAAWAALKADKCSRGEEERGERREAREEGGVRGNAWQRLQVGKVTFIARAPCMAEQGFHSSAVSAAAASPGLRPARAELPRPEQLLLHLFFERYFPRPCPPLPSPACAPFSVPSSLEPRQHLGQRLVGGTVHTSY